LLKRRSEIHKRIGEAIEKLYPERLEEFFEMLAYHYSKGEDSKKAFQYLKFSGNKATRNHSVSEAYRFYSEAIDTLNQFPETEEYKKEKLDVLDLVTIPISLLGFPKDSFAMLEEGERLSKELGDNRRLGSFHGRIGVYHSHKGNHLLSMKYSEDAIEVGFKNQDLELIVPIAVGLFGSYQAIGRNYKIVDKAPGILDLIEKTQRESDLFTGSVNSYCALCAYCGLSMGNLGNFKEGKIFLEKGLRIQEDNGIELNLSVHQLLLGVIHLQMSDLINARSFVDEALRLSKKYNEKRVEGMSWIWLGKILEKTEPPQIDKAEESILKGIKILHELQLKPNYALGHLFLGELYLNTNEKEMAIKNLKKAEGMFQEMGMDSWLARTQEVLAKV